MANQSALAAAMKGDKVSDRQAKTALGQAVTRIASLTKRANASKEAMAHTGSMVVHTAETQGSLFLASMAEGYFGEEKLKIGSVDVRAPLAIAAQGYGLYDTMKGGKNGGAHLLALGNGLMGSWLATVARKAGQTLATKKGATTPMAQSLLPQLEGMGSGGMPFQALLTEPALAGPPREVVLTPRAERVRRRHLDEDDDLG